MMDSTVTAAINVARNNMSPLVSIIVPVYNVEKYIEKCVNSLTDQSYDNIEIILVDDGSPDKSGVICDKMSSKNTKIIVIHKENGGVSSARNAGIERANGEYICFVDGDDFVTSDYIKDMLDIAQTQNVDIVTCNQYKIWSNEKKIELFGNDIPLGQYIIKTGINTLSDMLYGKTCYATCCCKLYKKTIFSEIRFPALSMGEDSFTMYNCFLKATNVAHLHKPNYYYLQHQESAMHTDNFDKFYDYIQLSDDFIQTVNDKYPELFLPAVNRLIENNFWVYMKMRNYPERYKNELMHITKNIKKYRSYSLRDKNVCIRTRIACLLSYGGMRILNNIYDLQK